MRLIAAVFLLLLSTAWVSPPLQTQTSKGDQAYFDSVARFWHGTATNGYVINLAQAAVYGNPSGSPLPQVRGDLWQYAQMANLFYGYWKITGSADAANRITANWTWVKSYFTFAQLTTCGVGTAATASDDAAWMIGLMLQAYEVTADSTALTDAKALLDCAYTRWYDASTLGGGMWYDDSQASKSSYQAVYALTSVWYYQLAADATYLTRAQTIDTWMSTALQRNGQVNPNNGAQTFPNDGMYWVTLLASGSVSGYATPYLISQTSSVVLQVGDMAAAVLDARLYAITGTASYLARVNSVAQGIQAYETSANVMIDARDARVNGWAAALYAREVISILTAANTFGSASIKATANSIVANSKNNDQTYSGCWAGPASNSSCVWATGNSLYSDQVEVSANAAIWPVAALALP